MVGISSWRTAHFLCIVLLASSLALIALANKDPPGQHRQLQWEEWKKKYGKKYSSREEENEKRAVWERNLAFIQEHNSKAERTFNVAMNEFGDQFEVSTKAIFPADQALAFSVPSKVADLSKLPGSVDWRTKGYVTGVRNQGECGGAVAYAAADTVASHEAVSTQKPARVLSAQEVNDCCAVIHRKCLPPLVLDKVFDCIHSIGGLCTVDTYHKSTNFTCNNASCPAFGKVPTGGQRVTPGDEAALAAAVAIEPVMAGLDANHSSFASYESGIYVEPDCETAKPNHAMVVVGYGSKNGQDYWICKNSWGTEWGMKGYILIARNHGNMCGIASNATYPI